MNRLTNSIAPSALMVAALASVMVLQPGCEKKKPPPPPPAPVVEAPPPEITFVSIMQTLQSDPRVKAPDALSVTDESFARATVAFADAFAKGDAEKLKGVMNARAKGVLESMVNDGSWDELKPRIEEVRIVYAGTRASVSEAQRAEGIKQMKAMQPGQMKAFEDILIKQGMDKNEMARFMAEYQLKLDADLLKAQFDGASRAGSSEADAAAPVPDIASDAPEMALLIAVQTPAGAELLGWSGRKSGGEGGNWVFGNASTLATPRVKASDWDNVGMFGFSLGTGRAPLAAKPVKVADDKKPNNDQAPAPVHSPDAPAPDKGDKPDNRPPRDPRKLVPGNH
jgi:hypothetical protein